MSMLNDTRECKVCKERHPLTEEYFPPHGKDKSGNQLFRYCCRDCWRQRERDYHATPEAIEAKRLSRKRRDPEVVKAEKARSQKKHPESNKRRTKTFLERHPEYLKEKHLENKDRNVKRATDWNKEHADQFNARQRKRRKNNPIVKMKEAVIRHKRRAQEKAAEGFYTHEDILRIYEEQEHRCVYCGITLYWSIDYDIHIEHIEAISKGGTNWPDNIVLSCETCNLSKGDKELTEWYATRGW